MANDRASDIRRTGAAFQARPQSTRWCKAVAVGLIAAGTVFGPLAFGATEVWSLAVLQGLAAVAALVWLAAGPGDGRWLWLPAGVGLVGLVQVLPLPQEVLAALSPYAEGVYAGAKRGSGLEISGRLSLAPGKTLDATRQGFLLALVVAMLADVARNAAGARWLGRSVAAAGAGVLVIGLATWPGRGGPLLGFHDMRGPLRSYKSPLLEPMHSAGFGRLEAVRVGQIEYGSISWNVGDTFGPYVVSNHYGGCLELGIPLAVALVVGGGGVGGPRAGSRNRWRWAMVGVIAAAAFATVALGARSWAGTAGLALGLAWVAWQMTAGRTRRVWATVFVGAVCTWIALVGVFAAWDVAATCERAGAPDWLCEAATSLQKSVVGRCEMWRLCTGLLAMSPWAGLGFGSFAEVYPRFNHGNAVLAFAHCDYFQLAAEGGLTAVALLAAAGTAATRRVRRGWAEATAGSQRALVIGLTGSLVAFLPHGLFDWNLHVPANAFLLAVVVGTLLGVSAPAAFAEAEAAPRFVRRLARDAVAGAMIVAAGLCIGTASYHVAADRAIAPLREALVLHRMRKPALLATEKRAALERSLAGGLLAAEMRPGCGEYAETLGQAYLLLAEGSDPGDLASAAAWFRRALACGPLKDHLRRTLTQIDAVISELQ